MEGHGELIPRNDRIRIPLRNHALMRAHRANGFSIFCLVQCVPFVLAWLITLGDFSLTLWLYCQDKSKITVGFHEDWEWEVLFLTILAACTMCVVCAAGGIVASRVSVPVTYKMMNGLCLSAITGLNIGWLIHEVYRGHYPEYKIWNVSNPDSMMSDFKGEYGVIDGKLPSWITKMQHNSQCCGVDSFLDWSDHFDFISIPDSCCVIFTKGCGDSYFNKVDWQRPDVLEEGCAHVKPDATSMNYEILNLLIVLKTVETILLASAEIIWLFCFITEYPEIEIQTRRRTVSFDQPDQNYRSRVQNNENMGPSQKIFCSLAYPRRCRDEEEFRFEMANRNPQQKMNFKNLDGNNGNPMPLYPISSTV